MLGSSASMLQLVTPVVNAEYLFLFPVKKKLRVLMIEESAKSHVFLLHMNRFY